MKTKRIERGFEIRAMSDDGTFEGYASVFGVEDSYSDIVMHGAFRASLERHTAAKTMPALLWQHRSDMPIGAWKEMREDDYGLWGKARLSDTAMGRDARELLKDGAITGLSIGFSPVAWEHDKASKVTKLTEIDLWETSLVTFPANKLARVSDVKQILADGEMPSPKSLEHALRDELGMSRRQAAAFMAGGYKTLTSLRDADEDGLSDALKRLQSILTS